MSIENGLYLSFFVLQTTDFTVLTHSLADSLSPDVCPYLFKQETIPKLYSTQQPQSLTLRQTICTS